MEKLVSHTDLHYLSSRSVVHLGTHSGDTWGSFHSEVHHFCWVHADLCWVDETLDPMASHCQYLWWQLLFLAVVDHPLSYSKYSGECSDL